MRHVCVKHVCVTHVCVKHVCVRHACVTHVCVTHVCVTHVCVRHVCGRHVCGRHVCVRHVCVSESRLTHKVCAAFRSILQHVAVCCSVLQFLQGASEVERASRFAVLTKCLTLCVSRFALCVSGS